MCQPGLGFGVFFQAHVVVGRIHFFAARELMYLVSSRSNEERMNLGPLYPSSRAHLISWDQSKIISCLITLWSAD